MNALAAKSSGQSKADVSTREALLNAAEELIAIHGISGASIRGIVEAAGANLGAITYHFGTKDRLVTEVFVRRMRPLDQERISRLDALEKSAGRRKLKLEQIVDALVRPLVELEDREENGPTIVRLICRSFLEVNPVIEKLMKSEITELAKRFDAAILRAVPGLRAEHLFWRIIFSFGAIHAGLESWSHYEEVPDFGGKASRTRLDREEFIQQIVAYVSAGIASSVLPSSFGGSPVRLPKSRKTSRSQPD